MSTERVIVHKSIAMKLVALMQAHFQRLRAGDPEKDGSRLSCQASESFAQNIVDLIQEAKKDGATIEEGTGERTGAVIQPHILMGVKPGMRAWERESFGPGEFDLYVFLSRRRADADHSGGSHGV